MARYTKTDSAGSQNYLVNYGDSLSLLGVRGDGGDKVFVDGFAANFTVKVTGNTINKLVTFHNVDTNQNINIQVPIPAAGSASVSEKILFLGGSSYLNVAGNGTVKLGGKVLTDKAVNLDTLNPATLSGNSTQAFEPFKLTVKGGSVVEGDSGTKDLTYTLTLDHAPLVPTTVKYSTLTTGTATAGTDFAAKSGSVTFKAGETSKTVTVTVNGDTTVEANETVKVKFTGADLAAAVTGTATITNDDPTYTLTSAAASASEGSSATFNLKTTQVADGTVLNYTLTGVDAADVTGGALTGTTTVTNGAATITVDLANDLKTEGAETLNVAIDGTTASATTTVNDSSTTPSYTLTVGTPSVAEGDSGTTSLTFDLTLDSAAKADTTVNYATLTTGSATAGTDFAAGIGSVTFAAGETTKQVTVTVNGDTSSEGDETVAVQFTGDNLAAAVTATGTITNDDGAPPIYTLTSDAPSVIEGNSGTANLVFNLKLDSVPTADVTVNYETLTSGTATAGTDFTASTGTITFTAGSDTATVSIPVIGDTTSESGETVNVKFSGSQLAGDVTGAGTITNDDVTFTLTQSGTSVVEGNTVVFTVTASSAVATATSLTYSAVGDTLSGAATAATAGTDYTPASGAVAFAAGDTSKTVTLTFTDDGTSEGLEGLKFSLLDSSLTLIDAKSVSITDGAESAKTITLTTAADSGSAFTGGAGNDTFNGTLSFVNDQINDTSTLTDGDALTGGSGTDTLKIAVSGSAVTDLGYTATPSLTGIERVLVSTSTSDTGAVGAGAVVASPLDNDVAIDLSLTDSSLTTIGTSSSTTIYSDVVFTNVGQIVAVDMAGKGDLNVGFGTTVVSGGSDSLTVTANGVGTSATALSTLTFNGIETANITSSTSANYLSVDGDGSLVTINIAGTKDIAVVAESTVTKVDASTATGNVTVDATALTLADVTLTGGSGTDALKTDEAITVTSSSAGGLKNVSGFEKIVETDAQTIALSAAVTGLTTIDISDSDDQVVTLGTGLTQAITVIMNGDATANNDTVTNTAGVELTVEANSDDVDNTTDLTGGAGNDTLKITANGGTVELDNVTLFETITIVAGTLGTEDVAIDVNNANNTVASTKTMTVNATALTNSGARLEFTGAGESDGFFSVTGGAGNDSIIGGSVADTVDGGANNDTIDGAAGNDVLTGGAGNDSITAGAGNDSISAGDGNDTIAMSTNLTSADTIDGGAGTSDTLTVESISGTALTNVTNVENLAITGTSSVSLTANLGFTAFDLTDTGNQVLTLGTGYTNTTTVSLEAGDKVANNANVALTVSAATLADITTGTTITGGTGTDAISVYADGTTATLTDISGVETITVLANKTTAGTVAGITTVTGNVLADKKLTVDASALTNSSATFTFNGSAETTTVGNFSVTGGAGNDVLTGGDGNDTISGGTGNDTIAANLGKESLMGGDGNDTFTLSTNITYEDTIAGGAGTDILTTSGTRTDVDFQNVTGVETLTASAVFTSLTIGSFASAAGVATVNTFDTANNTILATGMSTGVTYNVNDDAGAGDTITAGTGNDTFVFVDNDLDANDSLTGTSGTDVIRLDNDNNADGTGNAVTAVVDKVVTIDQITVNDIATDNSAGTVSITMANSVYDLANLVVDGSALDAGETLTFNAIATTMTDTDETFSVTGGAANDTMTGGAGNDTLSGGDGNDLITGDDRADNLTGGTGNDTFAFAASDSAGSNVDTVTDFEAGADEIKLTYTLSAAGTFDGTDKGDAASNADGLSLLSSVKGQYFFNTGNKQLVVDVDGNGLIQATDTVVNLTGETGLDEADVRIFVTGFSGGANTLTAGAGDDVIVGNDNTDSITGGSGADYLNGTAGNDVDTLVGGAGDDVYAVADEGEADVIVEGSSAGTDTIFFTDTYSLEGVAYHATAAASATADASLANIEQIVITTGKNAIVDSDQITGLSLKVVESGAGASTSSLVVNGDSGADTINLGSLSYSASGVTYVNSMGDSATTTALTSRTDWVVIDGGDGDDVITLNTGISESVTYGASSSAMTSGTAETVASFTVGTNGDLLDFDAFVTGGLYNSLTPVADTATTAIALSDIGGRVALVSTSDITSATITEAALLAASKAFAAEGTVAYNIVLLVGETAGTDGVKVVYVADGTGTDDMTVDVVGTLTGISLSGLVSNNFDAT